MPPSFRRSKKAFGRIDAAEAVIDQVDLDPAPLLLQQQIRELPPDFVVLDDVGLEVDMVARGADCGEHRGVGGRSVLQQDDLVAQDQRAADDGLFQRDLLVQDIDVAGLAFEFRQDRGAFLRRKRTARILEPGRLPGVPLDQGIGIGQRSATCRNAQESRQRRSQFINANSHDLSITQSAPRN